MTHQFEKSDIIGSISSLLCLVHCIATPFIIIALSDTINQVNGFPIWLKSMDYIFLTLSFFAVYSSVKKSTTYWVKLGLIVSWTLLLLVIMNEKFAVLELAEETIYLPSLALVFFHIYNLKYCTCKETECCAS